MSEQGRVNYGLTGEVGTKPITEYGKRNSVCRHGVSAWNCTMCMLGKSSSDIVDKKDHITLQEAPSGLCKHVVKVKDCDDCKEVVKSPEYFVMQRRKLEDELLNNLLEAIPSIKMSQVEVIMSNRWLILSELMNYDKKLMDIIRARINDD